jgi:hypothetical protein
METPIIKLSSAEAAAAFVSSVCSVGFIRHERPDGSVEIWEPTGSLRRKLVAVVTVA